MTTAIPAVVGFDIDTVAQALATVGYSIIPNALPLATTHQLFNFTQSIDTRSYSRAGIGRDQIFQHNPLVRKDRILWLDEQDTAANAYLDWMNELRLGLNQRLFLGLFDYECHYAWYPRGAFYKRHMDAFKGGRNRILSTVFYLNPQWTEVDEGELVIYANDSDLVLAKVAPVYGTIVIFLSEEFPHEVLTTQSERFSIAGWFRGNHD